MLNFTGCFDATVCCICDIMRQSVFLSTLNCLLSAAVAVALFTGRTPRAGI